MILNSLVFSVIVLVTSVYSSSSVNRFNAIAIDNEEVRQFSSQIEYLFKNLNLFKNFTNFHQNIYPIKRIEQEALHKSVNHRYNDTLCDQQLQYFSTALSGFEFWALNS